MSFGHRPGEKMKTKVKQTSDLIYCDKGGNITCCFANELCEEDFVEIDRKVRR